SWYGCVCCGQTLALTFFVFSFLRSGHLSDLHSFPTRRSSDLADSAHTVQHLMRRSLRMGVVSREMETVVGGRVLHLAVTVSSLGDRKSTRLNSSHLGISYAVFCLKKKTWTR